MPLQLVDVAYFSWFQSITSCFQIAKEDGPFATDSL
jgi:hypothetical protein